MTTECILTGCSILIHDPQVIVFLHGDLKLDTNPVTGAMNLYLGGIAGVGGKMFCSTHEKDSVLPAADLIVHSSIFMMPVSASGYGQVGFSQGSVEFGPKPLEMLHKYFPADRILHLYEKRIIDSHLSE